MGGIGGGPLETMIVMEAVGRGADAGAVSSPPWCSAPRRASSRRHDRSSRRPIIPEKIDGRRDDPLRLPRARRQARYDLFDVATTAREAEGWGLRAGRP